MNRTLFEVATVPSQDSTSFPNVKYELLEMLPTGGLHWICKAVIDQYFNERMASKGNDKGRRLFMCDFLKSCSFYKKGDDLYFMALCSAEMKKSVDYQVRIHMNSRDCEIMKTHCQCPAGSGFSAACKHVSALLYALEFYVVTGRPILNLLHQ